MHCEQCGKQVPDDVKFCPGCGAAVGATARGDSRQPGPEVEQARGEAPGGAQAGAPTPGGIAEQVSRSRRRSRGRMPLVLIIILVSLALAGAAFAAAYVYRTYIAPPAEEQTEQPAEAEPPADVRDNAADDPADEPAEPELSPEERAQRAVYDEILSEYRASQEQGWENAMESDLADLSSLGVIAKTQESSNVGVTYDELESGTVSYAYTDLGKDGVLDLVVATVQDDGTYQVLGLFSTDGSAATSLMNGDLLSRSQWRVLEDGSVLNRQSEGASYQNLLLYQVVGGQLVPDRSARLQGDRYNSWNSDMSAAEDPESAYEELSNAPAAALDWQPLDAFEPYGE